MEPSTPPTKADKPLPATPQAQPSTSTDQAVDWSEVSPFMYQQPPAGGIPLATSLSAEPHPGHAVPYPEEAAAVPAAMEAAQNLIAEERERIEHAKHIIAFCASIVWLVWVFAIVNVFVNSAAMLPGVSGALIPSIVCGIFSKVSLPLQYYALKRRETSFKMLPTGISMLIDAFISIAQLVTFVVAIVKMLIIWPSWPDLPSYFVLWCFFVFILALSITHAVLFFVKVRRCYRAGTLPMAGAAAKQWKATKAWSSRAAMKIMRTPPGSRYRFSPLHNPSVDPDDEAAEAEGDVALPQDFELAPPPYAGYAQGHRVSVDARPTDRLL